MAQKLSSQTRMKMAAYTGQGDKQRTTNLLKLSDEELQGEYKRYCDQLAEDCVEFLMDPDEKVRRPVEDVFVEILPKVIEHILRNADG